MIGVKIGGPVDQSPAAKASNRNEGGELRGPPLAVPSRPYVLPTSASEV